MNGLSPAEQERLGKLTEETGEVQIIIGKVQQVIGKIHIHGYLAQFEGMTWDNRADLERELGDLRAAIDLMVANGDLNDDNIERQRAIKSKTITKYMHHQEKS